MTKKRIRELADYFYATNPNEWPPARISLSTHVRTWNLSYMDFVDVMTALSNTAKNTSDLNAVLDEIISRIDM